MRRTSYGFALLLLAPLTSLSCGYFGHSSAPDTAIAAAGRQGQSAAKIDPLALSPNPALRPLGRSKAASSAAPALGSQPVVTEVAERLPPPPSAPATRTMGDVSLGTTESPITETLDKSLAMLAKERAESETLRRTVADLKDSLAQRDRKIDELSAQLRDCNTKVEKLEGAVDKWKEDVLGFRDEMRKAEEAQIDALQQVLTMLGKNKAPETAQKP